jgi:hypothetical protein
LVVGGQRPTDLAAGGYTARTGAWLAGQLLDARLTQLGLQQPSGEETDADRRAVNS